jgi:sugar lactone lactonase YvrE
MSRVEVFDDTRCALGVGTLWHPESEALFWFDINAYRLHSRTDAGRRMWQFDTPRVDPECDLLHSERRTLFVTTANQEIEAPTEHDRRTYVARVDAAGQNEHRVIL